MVKLLERWTLKYNCLLLTGVCFPTFFAVTLVGLILNIEAIQHLCRQYLSNLLNPSLINVLGAFYCLAIVFLSDDPTINKLLNRKGKQKHSRLFNVVVYLTYTMCSGFNLYLLTAVDSWNWLQTAVSFVGSSFCLFLFSKTVMFRKLI